MVWGRALGVPAKKLRSMSKEFSGSIFDEARRRAKKEARPSAPKAPPPRKEARDVPPMSDEELESRMKDAMQKLGEISEKIGKIYDAMGKSREEIRTMLENPSNFTEAEWADLQERRKALARQLFKENAQAYEAELAASSLAKASDRRKKKTAGSRRKGWMPMK